MDCVSLGELVETVDTIGIIGYGHVGKAILWSHRRDKILVNDPNFPDSKPITDFVNCDAIYVCVPSPSQLDGSCDTSILEQVLKDIWFANVARQTIIISKTTAPPSTYERLQKQYPNLVHVPEFLRETQADRDYANATWKIFGGGREWAERARDFSFKRHPISNSRCLITDIKTAAFYKYFANSFLAAKVSFANEWEKLAKKLDIQWSSVQEIAYYDERIHHGHLDVPGYNGEYGWAGSCFPKDIAAIIAEAKNHNIDFELLKDIVKVNEKHRGIND